MSAEPGGWERRAAATSSTITALARRWTAARGFGGFTVDEVCAEVGVSRRTFFNYFATKEDAVLGISSRVQAREVQAIFLEAPRVVGPNGLSTTLIEDLAELLIARWEEFGLGAQNFDALVAAMEQAPRLLGRALQLSREQEQGDIALVAAREDLPPDDLRAGAVVHVLGSLLRGSVEATFAGRRHEPLRTVFGQQLDAARSVFSSDLLRMRL